MKLYRIIGAEGRITIPFVLRQIIGFRPSDVVLNASEKTAFWSAGSSW